MPTSVQTVHERRAGNTDDWLHGICREFSDATGWVLKFLRDSGKSESGFDRRELDWCWHEDISDGHQKVGAFHLDVPGIHQPNLSFESAHRLAELLAAQTNQILNSRRHIKHQAIEIGALVTTREPNDHDIRMRLRALLRASVCLPRFRGAALFVLDPDGRSIRFRMSHHIAENDIPTKRRQLEASPFDLEALEIGVSAVTVEADNSHFWLPEDMKTAVCVSVGNDSGPIGTLWLYDRRQRDIDDKEVLLLRGFGNQIADTFERIVLYSERDERQKLVRELDVVASATAEYCDIAERFPGCDIAVRNRSRCEVGGDLCDVVRLDEKRTMVMVGDGSGDSIPAAIVMTAARGALHACLESNPGQIPSPDQMLAIVNRALFHVTACQQFLTLIVGIYDQETGIFTYSNAGHPPPIFVTDGEVRSLESQGLLLGVVEAADYSCASLPIGPDDLLVLFSDGIVEAQNASKEMFCNEGILAGLEGHAERTASEILENIWTRYEAHTGGRNLDDRTLVIMKGVAQEE
ncbi:MAG: PP2C family protein-serine/threonine phosphatase [Planctomycetales bacterium]|jgi:serine phosphatase RsbU (regulator of sigma subunit)